MSPSSILHRLNAPPSTSYPNASPKSSTRSRPSPAGSPQSGQPSSPRASPRAGSSGTIDIDAVVRANGGDVRRALEVMVAERNNLQAQNSQLWKLIEKQRAQCAILASDNDRLRQDREKANEKLQTAGIEPVSGNRRIPNSSSAVGLGLKAEHPQIKRQYSDRDETPTKASVHRQKSDNNVETSAPSSPAQTQPPSGLLPSPIPDKKTNRESKMTFPPEVSTFMTLADSPMQENHTIPAMPPSNSFNTLSPASQYSASPSVSGREEIGVVPPPSSRALAVSTATPEPSRSNEQLTAIPERPPPRISGVRLPQPDRESTKSPVQSVSDTMSTTMSLEEPIRSSFESSQPRKSHDTTPRPSLEPSQAEASQSRSSLNPSRPRPQMTSSLLSYSRITIPSSTVFPNSSGRDVLCFIIAITARPPNAQPITWNVAKLFSAFLDLETKIKAKSGKRTKDWKQMVAPLPEGRAWKDFAPSKIDQRKAALEAYLQSLLVAPISDKSDLCNFLNSDHVKAKAEGARKEGYLTKKGKNFGGWKTRYFVLDGPVMEYYESRGGPHLGSITITNAQIGRQNRPAETTDERNFRHAFLIIEASKRGTTNRHVLCAESDMERDSWIEMLVRYVDPEPAQATVPQPSAPVSSSASSSVPNLMRKRSQSRKGSKDVIVTAAQPMTGLGADSKFSGAPSPSLINSMESQKAIHSSQSTSSQASNPSISTQSSGLPQTPTQDQRPVVSQPIKPSHHSSSSHGSAPMTMVTSPSSDMLSSSPPTNSDPTPRANKRQSMMPGRPSYSPAYLTSLSNQGLNAPPGLNAEKERDRKAKSRGFWGFGKTPEKISRPVFAVPLTESIAVASVANLPAIVFRCIEWLEAKKAEQEEGIYRLSGSSAVIKGLKDRFDAEGDVNLLSVDEFWDPHAIAGLLKTFLRELPTSLLTRELHTRFLAVMDLIDSSARVNELSRLVSELPPPNYALLRALTAHLILIVRNATLNKMTLRNIGIVFSPTLGIPAGIFSELVSNFGAIFDDEAPSEELVDEVTTQQEDMEETIKRKRNSMLYQAGGADAMLGLTGRALDPSTEDSASEISNEDIDSDLHSIPSSDNLSNFSHTANLTPRAQAVPSSGENYPSAAAVRKAKAASRAQERGLAVETTNGISVGNGNGGSDSGSGSRTPGLPVSPKPGSGSLPSPRKEREVQVS
ncbi:hypothetical protein I302_100172 [Kwoniella bestiolae CBS 10118]|uniref:RalA-binding protein 1 n=1 Tax=Kwoniella bestiolae CBS 10118 TaxID=1296100 RepID=A0A1B9G4D0_9TREE|nr:hypothetical protein I302_03547 [Kwoniella bestiolae CBS 10118]OCF25873.1 hypothetical protein I302_03547 [Kwoniella bestiolae CBS 10118]